MWSVTNYEGQYAFGTSGVLTNAMFELCRAVNERQAAIGLTLTEFKDKDGNLGSNRVLDDFVGMFVTGENNHFRYNCTQIMNWIRIAAANGWFTESSGLSPYWTPTTMMADIGLGSSWLNSLSPYYPSNVCDYIFYQRCQEALNRMTHVAARNRHDGISPILISGGESDTGYATMATAWSNRYENPYASPITSWNTQMQIGMSGSGGVLFFNGQAVTHTYTLIPYKKEKYRLGPSVSGVGSSAISGVTSESYVGVLHNRAFSGPPGASVSFGDLSIEGDIVPYPVTSLPLSPLDDGIFLSYRLFQIDPVPMSDDVALTVSLDEPSAFSAGTNFRATAGIPFLEVYVDISSELSDQT